ncbi:hypothetical protein [Prevotella sp. 10(H)]|uniref:hypothetical protein n=1 Tax=Prevotella sp. 10(H) TaxID=1158294 RepID=UPI0004A6D935|nr:hypothetical protein [Prevotella sp. 10(H)]
MKKVAILFFLACALFSCSNEEADVVMPETVNVPDEKTDVKSVSDMQSISFKYKGKEYYSDYTLKDDSVCIFANKEVEKLIMKLAGDSTLSLLVKEDGSLEYFDNSNLLEEHMEKTKKTTKASTPVGGFLSIWNDPDRKGYWMGFEARFGVTSWEGVNGGCCSYVGDKMNNKISSFELYGAGVVFYANRDFGGQAIGFDGGSQQYYYCSHLVNEHTYTTDIFGRPVPLFNWDDRISSFKVYQRL